MKQPHLLISLKKGKNNVLKVEGQTKCYGRNSDESWLTLTIEILLILDHESVEFILLKYSAEKSTLTTAVWNVFIVRKSKIVLPLLLLP